MMFKLVESHSQLKWIASNEWLLNIMCNSSKFAFHCFLIILFVTICYDINCINITLNVNFIFEINQNIHRYQLDKILDHI